MLLRLCSAAWAGERVVLRSTAQAGACSGGHAYGCKGGLEVAAARGGAGGWVQASPVQWLCPPRPRTSSKQPANGNPAAVWAAVSQLVPRPRALTPLPAPVHRQECCQQQNYQR